MSSTGSDAAPPARRRAWPTAVAGVCAAGVLIASAALWWPVTHAWSTRTTFDFRSTDNSRATIVAVIGTDARPDDDASADEKKVFGDRASVKGARADTVLLVRFGGRLKPQVLNVPRDLVITGGTQGRVGRVAIAWLDGPQAFASTLCSGLGIGIDAVVVADPVAFSRAIDGLGGLEIDSSGVLRDTKAHLEPTTAGRQTLSGPQALAWVRARNLEILRDGRWRPLADASTTGSDQSLQRTSRIQGVLHGISLQLAQNPQRISTATKEAMRGLGFSSSLSRAGALTTMRTLATTQSDVPAVRTVDGAVPAALITDQGRASIADFAGDARCRTN